MKNKMKGIMLVVLALVMGFSLMGCGDVLKSEENNEQIALTVIAGVHSNSMEIPLNSSTIRSAIYNTCYTYGDITFINVDGNPQVLYNTRIEEPVVKGLSPEKLDTIATEYTIQLQQILSETTASVGEIDTLKAIDKAAQALKGVHSDTTEKKLLILDSGLSTVGYLDFTKGLLMAKTDEIVNALKKLSAIPDLNGVDVTWAFCGEVSYPQEELTNKEKENLKNIWKAILIAAGAKSVEFSNDFISNNIVSGLPSVSTVAVEKAGIEVNIPDKEAEKIIIQKPIETLILDNASVQFVGDKATFVDEQVARKAIQSVATQLLNNSNNKVYVVGTTASGDEDFCKKLSYERAEAVEQVLIDMGVLENQLITMGLGCTDPWHETDIDNDGIWNEEKASQNRKVLIIDVNGKDAEKLNN